MIFPLIAAAVLVPTQAPQSWFTKEDYPAAALQKDAEGAVAVDLSISASGVPTDCKVIAPSPEPSLNKQTCVVLLERARFQPDGNSAITHYKTSVRWELNNIKLDPSASGSSSDFIFSAQDKVSNCHETLFGDKKIGLGDACEGIDGAPRRVIEYLLGIPVPNATKGALRMHMEPISQTTIEVVAPATAHVTTLAETRFDVLPSGRVANCKLIQLSNKLPQKDLCNVINSPETQFNPAPDGNTIQMRLVVDIWAA